MNLRVYNLHSYEKTVGEWSQKNALKMLALAAPLTWSVLSEHNGSNLIDVIEIPRFCGAPPMVQALPTVPFLIT